jgi:hypothetical protein
MPPVVQLQKCAAYIYLDVPLGSPTGADYAEAKLGTRSPESDSHAMTRKEKEPLPLELNLFLSIEAVRQHAICFFL